MDWITRLKWWQLTLLITVFYPLGTLVGRLISGKSITWDDMKTFVIVALFLGLIFGLIVEFIKRDKAKQDKN